VRQGMPQGRTKRRRESKTIKSCERIPRGGYYSNSFSCMLAHSLRESVIQIRANISRVPRNIRTCVANIITAGPVRPFATSCSKGSLEISIPDDRCVRYSHPARAVHISRRFPASECIRNGRLPLSALKRDKTDNEIDGRRCSGSIFVIALPAPSIHLPVIGFVPRPAIVPRPVVLVKFINNRMAIFYKNTRIRSDSRASSLLRARVREVE